MFGFFYNNLLAAIGLYDIWSIITALVSVIAILVFNLIVVLLIGSLIIKAKKKVIYKAKLPERKAKTLDAVTTSIIKYILYVILFFTVLSYFGIDAKSIVAIAGIGTVAIGFATQSIVKDFIMGSFILFEDQFGVGDLITVEGHTGVVEHIGMRSISIRSIDGDLHIIPNSEIKVVTNMSSNFKRAVVEVPINYNIDINNAIDVLKDEMNNSGREIRGVKDVPSVIGITELGTANVMVRIMVECELDESYAVEREIRRIVKSRFDRENFPPPYHNNVFK